MRSIKKIDNKEFQFLGRAVHILKPEVINELKWATDRPARILIHFQLLPALLKRFCEIKNIDAKEVIGVWQGRESTEVKTLFIAVILRLYNPDLLTGIHTDQMRLNLREELTRVLECNSTWISQRVSDIRIFLNPHHPGKKAHEDFKEEVSKLVEVLENEFKQQ